MATALTAFALIFLAELPDKTLYTVLVLATRGRAWPVLLGACLAFLVHGFIALGLGALLGELPEALVRYGAAALFLGFGLVLLLGREEHDEGAGPTAASSRTFLASFGLVFAAEWGDATQLATAALAARAGAQRWLVFTGATLALWCTAALAVGIGRALGPRLPRLLLRRVAGALFVLFAIVSAVRW